MHVCPESDLLLSSTNVWSLFSNSKEIFRIMILFCILVTTHEYIHILSCLCIYLKTNHFPIIWNESVFLFQVYTEFPRRNVPDFVRVFLVLKYTDITQNTNVQSWTVTEIMAREKCGLLARPRTVLVSWQVLSNLCPWVWCPMTSVLAIHVSCIVLGTLRTAMTWRASSYIFRSLI
jgi:hypothetical protein